MNNVFNSVQILPVFKLVKIISLVAVLLTVTISESRAAPAGCIGAENLGCGWKCDSCEEGYELYNTCWFQSCAPKCPENEERINGNCTRKCSENEERINGNCTRKCSDDEIRMNDLTCVKKSSHCEGGNICQNSSNLGISNCCYKTEGDTTTVYPDDKSQGYNAMAAVFPDNKNLVISAEATDFDCPRKETAYETVYISEGASLSLSNCHCCFDIRDDLKFVIPDNGVDFKGKIHNRVTIVCLGDIDKCKEEVSTNKTVIAATESQCNGSGSYYFTGSSCEHRPTDGTDITCEHEISGYVKVGNYCVSPENSYAKKHYTPAEAAQWLHDGNDNFVVLTFKK